MVNRRQFLGLGAATALAGCASFEDVTPRVLIIGAGFGGATCAKYLAMGDPRLQVVLVDRVQEFVSCPMSNLVVGGSLPMAQLTQRIDGLKKYRVDVLWGEAVAVDPARKVVHAWKAGAQTVELRRQLETMADGGVCIIAVPLAPYRSPSGPYERACQVAQYFKQAKPRSKVLVLDANPDVTSKGPLFKRAWEELYKGIVEYRPNSKVVAVDGSALTVRTEFDTVKGDVLNVVPPQRAADIAAKTGLITHNNRWCDVDWRTMESKAVKGIHVLGDATLSATGMPKSGHMANAHGKVCAAALVELINGREPNPNPVMNNTCYSFVSDKEVIHVASVHQYDAGQNSIIPVKGAGGVSAARSEQEGIIAWSWARNIWADMLA